MFGWRARIGFISPAPGGPPTSLLEMQEAAPDGVVFIARLLDGPASLELEDLRAMEPQIGTVAAALANKNDLDLILMAGAPIVLANGSDAMIEAMTAASGVPSTTNIAAIVNAIRRLGLGRVTVLSPYYPQHLVDLFEEHRSAFEYDWRTRFHLPLSSVGGSMTYGEAWRLFSVLAADPSSHAAAARTRFGTAGVHTRRPTASPIASASSRWLQPCSWPSSGSKMRPFTAGPPGRSASRSRARSST